MPNDSRPTQGEFHGDFSRDTFDPRQHFLRVLMQQGRVQLDADWNEQVSILLHYLQTLAKDLIGPHGGPGDGFKITKDAKNLDFKIGAGRYYVDGILCECDGTTYKNQPYLPDPPPLGNGKKYLVYLDVWERHITYLQDERRINEGQIREVALGLHGPDTATRSQVVWQVKVVVKDDKSDWESKLEEVSAHQKPRLKARAYVSAESTDPCTIQPEMRYRGAGNQLYRVEIHWGGKVADEKRPTFKWSRENGSVVFPIVQPVVGNTVALGHLGRDERFGLKEGDWVEMLDDDYVLQNRAEPLLRVEKIDRDTLQVSLHKPPEVGKDLAKHPLLRRWDHQGHPNADDGALPVEESNQDDKWLTLEDGVQIQFPTPEQGKEYDYRTGDYWLIPARTATGDVEWPRDANGDPTPLAPHGVEHHYAPLQLIEVTDSKVTLVDKDGLRQELNVLTKKKK
jgi:hypothetical protein